VATETSIDAGCEFELTALSVDNTAVTRAADAAAAASAVLRSVARSALISEARARSQQPAL